MPVNKIAANAAISGPKRREKLGMKQEPPLRRQIVTSLARLVKGGGDVMASVQIRSLQLDGAKIHSADFASPSLCRIKTCGVSPGSISSAHKQRKTWISDVQATGF
ncbi:MAG: hypothetical protein ABSC42_05210 [Tepidisphaeraceae bacterium]